MVKKNLFEGAEGMRRMMSMCETNEQQSMLDENNQTSIFYDEEGEPMKLPLDSSTASKLSNGEIFVDLEMFDPGDPHLKDLYNFFQKFGITAKDQAYPGQPVDADEIMKRLNYDLYNYFRKSVRDILNQVRQGTIPTDDILYDLADRHEEIMQSGDKNLQRAYRAVRSVADTDDVQNAEKVLRQALAATRI